jgi:nucleotidyltransferase/DNA polymerase involved in DNA repair
MCSIVVACALIPRFALLAALGERREMLAQAVALAPEPGGPQVVGEVSGAAEAFGIHAGMRLGEALARCPSLVLVAPDSERAEEDWEGLLRRLEGIGAAVEPAQAGEAFFEAEGLRGLWGGIESVLARARRALGRPVRLGAGPTRLCALAAAQRGRARRPPVVVPAGKERAFLAPLPVGLLRECLDSSWERAAVPDTLERLGVRTLGELAALPDDAIADRFGQPGLRALRLARGEEGPLRPRQRGEMLAERLELPEACSGQQLERALGLLIDRLLANPLRRGRSFRSVRLSARLAGGGSWRVEVTLRVASADRERLGLALGPRLEELPGPAAVLSLRALRMGPPAHDQPSLTHSEPERRRELLAEAVSQARAAAGKDAVMRVLDIDPDSRVPERRMMLTPFPEEARERKRARERRER